MKTSMQGKVLSISDITLGEGKVSSTGKSTVLFSERQKDNQGRVIQVTVYEPIGK